MGAVTVKATAISNADSQYPKLSTPSYLGKGQIFGSVGTLEVGVADSAGSLYKFVRVPSGARIHRLDLVSDAIVGFTSAKVGVYAAQDQSGNAGAAVSDNLFGSGIDLSVQQTEPYDVLFNNLDIVNIEKRLWELLGLTADPFVQYDIVVKSVTQSGGAGSLAMAVDFVI